MNRRQLLLGAAAAAVAPALPVKPMATGGVVKPGAYIVGERASDFVGIDLATAPDLTALSYVSISCDGTFVRSEFRCFDRTEIAEVFGVPPDLMRPA